MSRAEATEAQPAGLPGLRRQFQAWRTGKGSGEAIPQKLWASAAELARGHGANRIALALGLDSHKLKQLSLGHWAVRKSKSGGTATDKPTVTAIAPRAQFVELKAPVQANAPRGGEAVVQLFGADGTHVTLTLADSSPALPAVMAALRGRS